MLYFCTNFGQNIYCRYLFQLIQKLSYLININNIRDFCYCGNIVGDMDTSKSYLVTKTGSINRYQSRFVCEDIQQIHKNCTAYILQKQNSHCHECYYHCQCILNFSYLRVPTKFKPSYPCQYLRIITIVTDIQN